MGVFPSDDLQAVLGALCYEPLVELTMMRSNVSNPPFTLDADVVTSLDGDWVTIVPSNHL